MTDKAELAARFDRVLSALRAVIATETSLDPAWEETKKGVGGAFADAAFSRSQARRAFEDETPTMDALAVNLKDNRYKDPSWPTDGADDAQILRSMWHAFHDTIGAGKPFAPDDLSVMRNLYAALERAREKLTRRKTATRKRSRKAEVTIKIQAAILYKIDNPGATEKECAEKAEVKRTTLHSNPVWKEWSPKIEQAAASTSRLHQLRREWDRRTGQFLAVEAGGNDA
ncbi:hypothetical protein ACFL5Q_03355 [Planctomycetota bacterium]